VATKTVMVALELWVKAGNAKGTIVPLGGRRSLTIGRAHTNDLILSDEKVSSHHARLDIAPGGVILTDLGSKNGTYASGESIVGSRLLTTDVDVALGSTVFSLRPAAQTSDVTRSHNEPPPRPPREPDLRTAHDLVLHPVTRHGTRGFSKAQRNLAVLMAVGELISTERDPDRFLGRLLDLVFDTLPADRGCVLLTTKGASPRQVVTRLSDRAGSEEIQVSRTILSKVFDAGVSILTADAGTDARLAAGASIIAQSIRSAMCVPIQGKREVLGAIYVDTILSIGVFGKEDLEVLTTIGLLSGTALENIKLFKERTQQERMAAIGKVIAGLGHDIRNMLTALRGGMYLLDETLSDHENSDVAGAWDIVKHGHESIAGLVQDMVNYSKAREPDWRMASINEVALTAMAFAKERARAKRVQVTELLDKSLESFWFDPQQLERCVLNLLCNAIDAAPDGSGVVSVATLVDDATQTVRVIVQDNGEGIPSEHRERVFDLLYSTKGKRGTGFGLAITKKLIEDHGGRASVRSEVHRGTVFTLHLPFRTTRPGSR